MIEWILYLLILQAFLTILSQAGQGKEKRDVRNFCPKYFRRYYYYLLMLLSLCLWGFSLLNIFLSSKSIPWSLESPLLAITFSLKFNCQAGITFQEQDYSWGVCHSPPLAIYFHQKMLYICGNYLMVNTFYTPPLFILQKSFWIELQFFTIALYCVKVFNNVQQDKVQLRSDKYFF